jgi:hypothetical protein
MITTLQSVFALIYFISVKPFETRLTNRMEIFGELMKLLIYNHLYLCTNFVPDEGLQYYIGFSIIGITAIMIIVNMGIIFKLNFIAIKALINKLLNKYSIKRINQRKLLREKK